MDFAIQYILENSLMVLYHCNNRCSKFYAVNLISADIKKLKTALNSS